MKYPTQAGVTKRLQVQALDTLDLRATRLKGVVLRCWADCRRDLRAIIHDAYRSAASSGTRWDVVSYASSGAQARFRSLSRSVLESLRARVAVSMRRGLAGLRYDSAILHSWILDQVTPPGYVVSIPAGPLAREAVRVAGGVASRISERDWESRWSAWVDGYSDALASNIRLGAINASSIEDAVDEVDATRVNTPAVTMDVALTRLFTTESIAAMAAGEDDVVRLNEDAVDIEIWKTRGDARVCDDCDANEGRTAETADGDIPLHPGCNCFWEIVPESYAALLRSGDPEDRELARQLQARGIVPEALVIRNERGDVAAKAIVSFSGWLDQNRNAIRSGR